MKDEDWERSLEEGRYYEDLALKNHLEYDDFQRHSGSKYDIQIIKNDIITIYEVKSDKWTHRTGNIFIEFESNKIKSGISITKADYYLIFEIVNKDQYNLYKIPIDKLKELIKISKIKSGCGYNGLSTGYLVRKERCKDFLIFTNIKKICLI